jgi:hypothetical protein
MPKYTSFPDFLNQRQLDDQDGIIGSGRLTFYRLVLRDYSRGGRDMKVVEGMQEIQRFLIVITPRSIPKSKKNIIGFLNASEIARMACHIRSCSFFYTKADIEKLEEYKRKHKASLVTISKILGGVTVSPQEIEATKEFLNDLYGVFWDIGIGPQDV